MLLSITTGQRGWCASSVRLSLLARSLRGRPVSLRTFSERAYYRLPKPLIWRMLSAIRRATSGPSRFFSLLSGRCISGVAPAQQDFLLAGGDELALLVVEGGGEGDHAGRALRRQRRYLEHRIERVAGMNRPQKFRGLLDKGDQGVANGVGKGAGPRRGEREDLKAVRQWALQAALTAILEIVMDRVIVRGKRLESGEMSLGHRPARDVKPLSDRQILEIAGLAKAVPAAVEAFGHYRPDRPSQRSMHCPTACSARASISASVNVLSG